MIGRVFCPTGLRKAEKLLGNQNVKGNRSYLAQCIFFMAIPLFLGQSHTTTHSNRQQHNNAKRPDITQSMHQPHSKSIATALIKQLKQEPEAYFTQFQEQQQPTKASIAILFNQPIESFHHVHYQYITQTQLDPTCPTQPSPGDVDGAAAATVIIITLQGGSGDGGSSDIRPVSRSGSARNSTNIACFLTEAHKKTQKEHTPSSHTPSRWIGRAASLP